MSDELSEYLFDLLTNLKRIVQKTSETGNLITSNNSSEQMY